MTKRWYGVYVKYGYGSVESDTKAEAREKLENIDEVTLSQGFEDWVLEHVEEEDE